jgi:hypothetical protein
VKNGSVNASFRAMEYAKPSWISTIGSEDRSMSSCHWDRFLEVASVFQAFVHYPSLIGQIVRTSAIFRDAGEDPSRRKAI